MTQDDFLYRGTTVKKIFIGFCFLFLATRCFSSPVSIDPHILEGFKDCSINITFNKERGVIENLAGFENMKIKAKFRDYYAKFSIFSILYGIQFINLSIPIDGSKSVTQYVATLNMGVNKTKYILEKEWDLKFFYIGDDGMDGMTKNVYIEENDRKAIRIYPINKFKTIIECSLK